MEKPRYKHKVFDSQCKGIIVGSTTTKTQYSIAIDPYMETCQGEYKEGELQTEGLRLLEEYLEPEAIDVIRTITATKKAFVYVLFHVARWQRKIIHGVIVTNEYNRVIHRVYTGSRYQSNQIINVTAEWLDRRRIKEEA